MHVDEHWAYRKPPGRADLEEVVVTAISKKKPPIRRVKVRFLDDAYEGADEWVPVGRLKCLWDDRAAFLSRESQMDLLVAAGNPPKGELYAAEEAVELIASNCMEFDYSLKHGIILISDVPVAVELLGWSAEHLLHDPLTFESKGTIRVPWRVSRKIVSRLLQMYPLSAQSLIAEYKARIQQHRNECAHLQMLRFSRPDPEEYALELDEAERESVYYSMLLAIARLSGDEATILQDEVSRLKAFRAGAISAIREIMDDLDRRRSAKSEGLRVRLHELLDAEQAGLEWKPRDRPVRRS